MTAFIKISLFYPHPVPEIPPCVTNHRICSTLARSLSESSFFKVMAYFPCAASNADDYSVAKVQRQARSNSLPIFHDIHLFFRFLFN